MEKVKRLEELDSLRGIAALCVVFAHILLIFPENKLFHIIFEYSPLRILVAGQEAVILFFILSGFVLSLPFYKNSNISYLPFLIKRTLRIYSPYLFTILITILCIQVFYKGNIEGLSKWYNIMWNSRITTSSLLDHAILIKTFMSNLNPVIWSLVHEMRISIIFPFLMILIVKMNWKKGIIFGVSFSLLSIILFSIFKIGNDGVDFINTLHYVSIFVVGAFLAKYHIMISGAIKKTRKKSKFLLLGFALGMYLYAKPSFIIENFIYPNIDPFYRTIIDSWFVAFGSVFLIVLAISSPIFSKVLSISIIKYLGKISYSLYLSHILVLISMFQLFYGQVPTVLICLLSVTVTIFLSSLMYRYIENPSIQFGKVCSNKIKQYQSKRVKGASETIF